MKQLNIDIETYSSTDLAKAGVYKYAEDPSFSVLLFGYSIDKGPVRCIQCAVGEKIPAEVISALQDETVLKYAFNASFERICLSRYLGVHLTPQSWRCTMVGSLYLGLPGSLAAVGAAGARGTGASAATGHQADDQQHAEKKSDGFLHVLFPFLFLLYYRIPEGVLTCFKRSNTHLVTVRKTINDMGPQSLICSHAVRLTFAKAVLFRYSVVVRRCQRSLSCM